MSNILVFPNVRTTSASSRVGAVRQVTERARQLAAMPAAVTGNAIINRCCSEMQSKGWIVNPFPSGAVICRHPEHQKEWIELPQAYRMQRDVLGGVA